MPDLCASAYALTSLQRAMLLATLAAPESGAYIVQDVCECAGSVDLGRLREAWRVLEDRHPVLRTRFVVDAAGAVSQCFNAARSTWVEIPLVPSVEEFLAGDRLRPFDFERGTPIRLHVLRGGTLVMTCHHSLFDGRSFSILWRELFELYDGRPLAELTSGVTFADHVRWVEERDRDAAREYWRGHFAGVRETSGFLVDRLVGAGQSGFARCAFEGTLEWTQSLKALALAHGLTLNTLIQGAWVILLRRYSDKRDVVFGVTRAGRRSSVAGAEDLVGMFINSVPVCARVDGDALLIPWLRGLRQAWIDARPFEHTPADEIRTWLELPQGMPIFETLVIYENARASLAGGRVLSRSRRTDMPLTVAAYGSPVVALQIVYDASLFSERFVRGMLGHLETLLTSFVMRPDALLKDAGRFGAVPDETRGDIPDGVCAHELFERQVAATPDAIAIEHAGAALSYAEVNGRADRLARRLRQMGVGAEDLVGVSMRRSPSLIVAVLAVMKAGGAFVPLPVGLPEQRLRRMIEIARPRIVLVDDSAQLDVEGPDAELNAPAVVGQENAAYVVFTSGSTGEPKAVVMTHRSLVNHTLAAAKAMDIGAGDRRLQFASLSADVFVAEVFNYLCSGATLVMCLDEAGHAAGELTGLIAANRITIIGMPGSWWSEWVASLTGAMLPESLRAVVVGMERVDADVFRKWQAIVGSRVQLFNAYGPAEAGPTSTVYRAGTSEWEARPYIPVGKPIENTRLFVLDSDGMEVGPGIAGELFIGGEGVCRGYVNGSAEDQARFVDSVWGRLYRTGDRMLTLPDGNLAFLGRVDRQLKIRGFRIEPEEVEAALALYPGVRQCAVVGPDVLVAYIDTREEMDGRELRAHLATHLPAHMIPKDFMFIDGMKRTGSGKIDRGALPAFVSSMPLRVAEELSADGQRVADLWDAVLKTRPGARDNFFEMGGDSLGATRLLWLMRKEFQVEMSWQAFLRDPTVAGMAEFLDGPTGASDGAGTLLRTNERGSGTPLFLITSQINDLYVFRHIAKRMPASQPVYVMSLPIAEGDMAQDVPGLAGRVVEVIRSARPRGPYALGGYCFGGLLAFEVARQMLAGGEDVRLVAFFDTPAPGYPKVWDSRDRYLRKAREIVSGGGIDARRVLEHLDVLWKMMRKRMRRSMASAPVGAGTDGAAIMVRGAVGVYEPQPLGVAAAQFVAKDQAISTEVLEDPRAGWRDLCLKGFRMFTIPGLHTTLLAEENASEVAASLLAELGKGEL